MLSYFLFLAGVTVIVIWVSAHYMHKSGHDDYGSRKGAH